MYVVLIEATASQWEEINQENAQKTRLRLLFTLELKFTRVDYSGTYRTVGETPLASRPSVTIHERGTFQLCQ